MALLVALRRANASSSSLFTRFLNHTRNPSASRFFSSSVHVVDSSEENCTINYYGGSFVRSDQFPIHRGMCDQNTMNPFQVAGPGGAFEAKKVEEGLFVRMEMPGIEREDVRVWVEYGHVYVKGEGRKESKHEDSGRSYNASLELSSNSFQPEKIKAELKNGVLRILIPKTKTFKEMPGLHDIKIN